MILLTIFFQKPAHIKQESNINPFPNPSSKHPRAGGCATFPDTVCQTYWAKKMLFKPNERVPFVPLSSLKYHLHLHFVVSVHVFDFYFK